MKMEDGSEWEAGDPIGYVRAEIPEFDVPAYEGERYEVMAPDTYTGEIIAELSARAGTVKNMEILGSGIQRVEGNVPLARMFGFATALRSRTQGRGTFAMEFDRYAQVPESIARELIEKRKR